MITFGNFCCCSYTKHQSDRQYNYEKCISTNGVTTYIVNIYHTHWDVNNRKQNIAHNEIQQYGH